MPVDCRVHCVKAVGAISSKGFLVRYNVDQDLRDYGDFCDVNILRMRYCLQHYDLTRSYVGFREGIV